MIAYIGTTAPLGKGAEANVEQNVRTGPEMILSKRPFQERQAASLSRLVLASVLGSRCWLLLSCSPFPSDEEAHG
jgi:hypothetical protein